MADCVDPTYDEPVVIRPYPTELGPSLTEEVEHRIEGDQNLQDQIDIIQAGSDVVDVVATYAALQQYDTSTLSDKDVIKVLADETRDGATTYYRYSTTSETFTFVGAVGPYYTKNEADQLLGAKQDTLIAGTNVQIANDGKTISATDTTYTAGTNVSIDANNQISATDTTYSNFVGTDGTAAGAAGLVPAPATTDDGKFLKADGTWNTVNTSFATGEAVSSLKIYSGLGNNTDGLVLQRYVPRSFDQSGQDYNVADLYGNGKHHIQGWALKDSGNTAVTKLGIAIPMDYTISGNRALTSGIGVEQTSTISDFHTIRMWGVPFTGATSQADGAQGMVPKPLTTDTGKFLNADGTWSAPVALVSDTDWNNAFDVAIQNLNGVGI